jgi:Pvc16 N-terminal domain/Carboxypeptidase regulatory-like domain
MANAAAATMMLADLDEVLRELLERELAARGVTSVAITFDPPSRERAAQWSSPALDLFLYDLREAPGVRDRSLHPSTVEGSAVLVRAPLRLACSYAITAWAQTTRDEHRLLSQAIAILCAHQQLPVELLPASLLVGDPPQPLIAQVGHVRDEARAEFWAAVGGQYKVSLEYTVTVMCDPGLSYERGPAVRTEVITAYGRPPSREPESSFTIGGEVRDEHGRGLDQVAVSVPALGLACASDESGRFTLRSVPAGSHTIQARAAGRLASTELTVPGGGVVLTLASSTDEVH